MHRAAFLDRDGVINFAPFNSEEGKLDSPYTISEFRFLPGVKEAVRMLNEMGWLAIVVSNQPGVAKGKCTDEFLTAINEHMVRRFRKAGAHLDGIYYCRHHPEAIIPELRVDCECRKPRPGLIQVAAKDLGIDLRRSVLFGDSVSDIKAGFASNCRPVLISSKKTSFDHVVVQPSLLSAVQWLRSTQGEA
jgi:D-glycero-D-manno-heptose 1,7-bisphosphate phosphatase